MLLIHIHHSLFCKFHMVCTSQPPKICWQTSVQVCGTLFDLLPFWIASKQIFLHDENNFCHKPIWNHTEFSFKEKNSGKNYSDFFNEIPLTYWITNVYWNMKFEKKIFQNFEVLLWTLQSEQNFCVIFFFVIFFCKVGTKWLQMNNQLIFGCIIILFLFPSWVRFHGNIFSWSL